MHVGWEQLVDYWAGEGDLVEEHLFECDACAAESTRVARIVAAMRSAIPPVVSAEELSALRGRGLAIAENDFAPGVRQEVEFPDGVDLLIHHLGGLDLGGAERVDVIVRVESTGDVLWTEHFAPFDSARGEVLIACQRHFAFMPPDIVFDVRTIDGSGARTAGTFVIPHHFSGGSR